jgi:hypothetical protein
VVFLQEGSIDWFCFGSVWRFVAERRVTARCAAAGSGRRNLWILRIRGGPGEATRTGRGVVGSINRFRAS